MDWGLRETGASGTNRRSARSLLFVDQVRGESGLTRVIVMNEFHSENSGYVLRLRVKLTCLPKVWIQKVRAYL